MGDEIIMSMKTEEQKKIEKKERNKKYYEDHKVELNKQSIKYQKEHPEQKAETNKRWKLKNPEEKRLRHNEIQKIWVKNNPDKQKALCKNWRINNTEKANDITKNWRKNNPDKVIIMKRKINSKRERDLGFNPINDIFKRSEFHHINKIDGIFIPYELHKSIGHALNKPETIIQINRLAFDFLTNNIKQI